jgi:hypothetical protein
MYDYERVKRAKDVLRYVDALLPTLRINVAEIARTYRAFLERPGVNRREELHRAYVEIDDCASFLPIAVAEAAQFIVGRMQERMPNGKVLVPLAEVFTLLTVIVKGSVEEKAAVLFSMYNFGGSDRLTEAEHTFMIHRISIGLQKIGLIGRLDFTMADAKHAAFLARLHATGASKDFSPGLTVQELALWMVHSPVGRQLALFQHTLEQLIRVLLTLKGKTSSLLGWLSNLNEHSTTAMVVPKVDLFRLSLDQSPLFVVYRSSSSASIALCPHQLKRGDFFIQCNQLVQERPGGIYKHYRSYRRLYFPHESYRDGSLFRVDVEGLEPDSEYTIIVYQCVSNTRYRPISLRTLTSYGLISEFETVRLSVRFLSFFVFH